MAEDRQGTGKHPHKSTEEPYPHTKESQSKQRSSQCSQSSESNQSESSDLKEREYRDKEGNIHHHTHTSKEQQGK